MSEPLLAATEWYIRIHSDDVSNDDLIEFELWKESSSDNSQAWERIQQVNKSFEGLEPRATRVALHSPDSLSRRRALKKLSVFFVIGGASYISYRQQTWPTLLADYETDKGENQTLQLPDQTMLALNTNTAIDVDFRQNSRKINLIKGEILVETGHGKGSDVPLIVKTKFGDVSPLGTRFSVRVYEDFISINVFKDTVRISNFSKNKQKILTENQSARCGISGISEVSTLAPGSDLWVKGILVVTHMPLKAFLAEINRYHNGFLRCDPAISKIAVSGSFPLKDLNAILTNLQNTYPIKVESFTQYWITLKSA